MKRKYKEVQQLLDDAVLEKLKEGETDNAILRQCVREALSWHLTQTGDINVPYLLDALCGTELSNIKQRLRGEGLVEIGKNNEAKLVEDLTPEDAEFIDLRRVTTIAGALKTRVQFNHRHGRFQQAQEAAAQLSALIATLAEGALEDLPQEVLEPVAEQES
jgi:hypothetical protein